ncbi:MAG: phosphatidylglycerophosphatase A [Phycisphaerales bacterium]
MRPAPRLITTFGLGHLRPAPGTWGSLPPLLIPALFVATGQVGASGWAATPWILYHALLLLTVLVFGGACIVQGDRAEVCFHKKDPSDVVADETAGQCLPLMFLPASALSTPWLAAFTIFWAFVSFRIFDIIKPWPANGLQRVPGGWGILLDDLFAGVYALVVMQALTRVLETQAAGTPLT